jgi:hypothetical protein
MTLALWNQVVTTLEAPSTPPENFIKIPGIPSSTATGLAAFAGISAKQYATIEQMTDDGFAESSFEVLSATNFLAQDTPQGEAVTRWVVIALQPFVAQVDEFTVEASDDGTYELYLAPAIGLSPTLAASFVAAANTVTEIKDGLIISFNGGAFAADFTAADVDVDSGSVTANTAGQAFVLTGEGPNGTSDITVLNLTPNSGPADSLDPGFEEEPFWGVIPEPGIADGLWYEYSRWAEDSPGVFSTRRNVLFLQTSEAGIIDPLDTDNLALTLQVLQRKRTFGVYHVSDSDYMSASVFGLYGGQQAGRRAFHLREIIGTTLVGPGTLGPDVFTLAVGMLLKERNFGWIERDGNANTDPARFAWGQGSGGFFAEQVQAEDFWWFDVSNGMLEIQASEDGWTLDGPGIQKLVARVKQSNDTLASFNPPVVDSNNTSVTFVPLSEVPLSEQAVGDYQTTGRVTSVATLIPRGRSLRVDGVFPTA